MAPEQTEAKNTASPALDVYALGAVLYEAVSGRPPFLGATPSDTLLEVRSQDPMPLRQLHRQCPRDLETICLKCLHKEPARRYTSALALAEDLRRFLDGRPIEARPTSTAERLVKWARRHPVVAALAAMLALGTITSLTIITWLWIQAENALAAREHALNDLTVEKQKVDDKHYRLQLSAVREAWNTDNLSEALRILEECEPKLRADEWRALHRTCHALRHVWPTTNDSVAILAVAPDNRTVVAVGRAWGYLWDLKEPDFPPRTFKVPQLCYGLACIPDREFVLMEPVPPDPMDMTYSIDLVYCSLVDGKELRRRSFKKLDRVGQLQLSPDGRRLALVRFQLGQAEIELIDLRGGGGTRKMPLKVSGPPLPLIFSADGRWLAAITDDGLVYWDLDAGKESITWNKRKPLSTLAISPNGTAAIIRHPLPPGPTEILLVDLPTGTVRQTLIQPGVQFVAVSLDGRTVAAGSVEKPVQLWDVATGERGMTLRGSPKESGAGVFSRDGQWLVTPGLDGAVRLWNIKSD
jgi:WD40 repeat protein